MANIVLNTSGIKILTPSGWSDFSGVQKVHKAGLVHIITENSELKCTLKHPIKTTIGYKFAEEIVVHDLILSKDIYQKVLEVKIDKNHEDTFYDLLDVENGNEYYSNDLISHNCDFQGSAATLIAAAKLQLLSYIDPIKKANTLEVYKEPVYDHSYVITVDSADGVGLDYSAFCVFDVTQEPYEIVCTFNDNSVSPIIYPKFIYETAKTYNNATVLIETNTGAQVAEMLYSELEYESMISTFSNGRGTVISNSSKARLGIKSSKQTKSLGCTLLKMLIENDKLLINNFTIKEQLSRYVLDGSSYNAESGSHDDLVICCVLFAWLTGQPSFKDLTNIDTARSVYNEQSKQIEEILNPIGFVYRGETDEINHEELFYDEDYMSFMRS